MQWEDREESKNVEDRRGAAVKTGVAVGGGGILLALLVFLFSGGDVQKALDTLKKQAAQPQVQQQGDTANRPLNPEEEEQARFTKVIFGDTERVWNELFAQMGKKYQEPTLVLFTGAVESACGAADSAVGPFYCPGDSKVYIDLSFYRDMQKQLKAPGEFARAYVIAHEVGHHVQRLLGYSARVDQARRTMSKTEYNKMSVRLELQADYLAGVWAHHGQKKYRFLEPGDIESALHAAHQIGDDYLQKQARGRVVPDSFTHGTSEQRMRWFKRGFETGSVEKARALFEMRYEDL